MRSQRNQDGQGRRVFLSVCSGVLFLFVLSAYYSSVFSDRLKRANAPTTREELASTEDGSSADESRDGLLMRGRRRVGYVVRGGEADEEAVSDSKEERKTRVGGVKERKEEEKEEEESHGKEVSKDRDEEKEEKGDEIEVEKKEEFPVCSVEYTEIIPCHDRDMQHKMKIHVNTDLMEHYERHCPPSDKRLKCLIPPPAGYKISKTWPTSRDIVWRSNIPHTFLAQEKAGQNWMVVNGEAIRFPGGGTHFPRGADVYIRHLATMLGFEDEDISGGGRVRTVLDVGCGVASFGAYLLPYNVVAMSLAPNDVHANQIQFALERGIPSTLGVLGTMRLPYPSKSFELAHCSRCRIDWLQRDGVLLLELDRLLRPGGYFAWSSPPAYRDDPEDRKVWSDMTHFIRRICWTQVAKKGQTVIWQKPETNDCYRERKSVVKPPLCEDGAEADSVWGVKMEACITPLPEANDDSWAPLAPWPKRLRAPPARLLEVHFTSKAFKKDTLTWAKRVESYWSHLDMERSTWTVRNVMDMGANLGSFAAALDNLPVWVMNVVPQYAVPNTLKVVYDRGLIGTSHDWCEAFSTYPRTYDMIHGAGVFADVVERGCLLEDTLLEMDRILRPQGVIILRDKSGIIDQIVPYLSMLRIVGVKKREEIIWKWRLGHLSEEHVGARWNMLKSVVDAPGDDLAEEGTEKILFAKKSFWETPTPAEQLE